MPLTGPVSEGKKFFCPSCGALYSITYKQGAKKEGEIVFYTSLSLTDYPKILPHFEKSYPFIKTNTYRATPSGLFTRVAIGHIVMGTC